MAKGTNVHALIIEDEWFIADTIEHILCQIGYTSFDHAQSAAGAITAAERRCPDLIVADHNLSDGTGTEAVLSICADRRIAVVFVSAAGQEVRAAIPEALIVTKPFGTSSLTEAVNSAVAAPLLAGIK